MSDIRVPGCYCERMTHVQIPLPPGVTHRVMKNFSSQKSTTKQIETVIDGLHWYLDVRIGRYRRDVLIQELGFRVSRGLPSADQQAITSAGQRGLLIDGVGESGQLRAIAESKAARCLLERVVIAPSAGANKPNAGQLADFYHAGESLVMLETLRTVAQLADRSQLDPSDMPHLGTVDVRGNDDGIEYDYQPGDFDLSHWVRLVERPIGRAEINLDLFDNASRGAEWTSGDLVEISGAMVQDLGFSVNDLLDTLTVLFRVCLREQREFVAFESGASWGPEVSARAMDYLTFSDDFLTLGDLRPSDTRHQVRRIWTSPLMKRGTRYYVFRDIIFEAMNRWMRYLTQGDWPIPRNVLSVDCPNLHKALEKRSRNSGSIFEDYVSTILAETGLPHATLKNGARVGSVRLSREIDSVVVDPRRKKIHVLEFKNIRSDQNAMSLQIELKKFLGEYAGKLRRSMIEVEADKSAFIKRVFELDKNSNRTFDAIDDIEKWSVESAFVFNSHSPIECLTSPQFFSGINADHMTQLFALEDRH